MPLATKDWVYIHVPKTGGTWVRRCLSKLGLGQSIGHMHGSLTELTDEERRGRLVVTTARDPWSWYASWYFHAMYHPTHYANMMQYGEGSMDFKDVLRGATLLSNPPTNPIFISPSKAVTPGYTSGLYSWMFETLCDIPLEQVHVLDMHNLRADLSALLGEELPESKLNTRSQRDPRKKVPDVTYDKEMTEWVRQADARVIDLFGYHIPFKRRDP